MTKYASVKACVCGDPEIDKRQHLQAFQAALLGVPTTVLQGAYFLTIGSSGMDGPACCQGKPVELTLRDMTGFEEDARRPLLYVGCDCVIILF